MVVDAREHVSRVGLRVEAVHLGAFDQRHGRGQRLPPASLPANSQFFFRFRLAASRVRLDCCPWPRGRRPETGRRKTSGSAHSGRLWQGRSCPRCARAAPRPSPKASTFGRLCSWRTARRSSAVRAADLRLDVVERADPLQRLRGPVRSRSPSRRRRSPVAGVPSTRLPGTAPCRPCRGGTVPSIPV